MDNRSDRELVLLLNQGDASAFDSLYFRYVGRARAFLSKLQLDEYADDVLQEAFITIWRKRTSIQSDKSFDAYLFTIAKNYALKALKKKIALDLSFSSGLNQVTTPSPEQQLLFRELDQSIRQAINRLPDRPKTVFLLRRYEGLTTDQIASKLNLSVSTVENHMNRALQILRKDLSVPTLLLFFLTDIPLMI